MTGRDLNAWLGTGDGREPAPKPLPSAPRLDDQAWALAFMGLIRARSGGRRPCA